MERQSDKRSRVVFVALFLALLLLCAVAVGFAVRLAYLRYIGEFGEGSFAGLASLPIPVLCLLLGAPLLGFLFAVLVTTRAIRRAKKKEEKEREDAGEEDGREDEV